MIHLKTKRGEGFNKDFGILIAPAVKGLVDSDEQLYQAVREHGIAVVRNKEGLKLGDPIAMTPDEFREMWMGD